MASIKELRDLPAGELHGKIDEAHKELAQLRLKASQGSLEQPHRIQLLRREVARMMTILTEQAHTRPGR